MKTMKKILISALCLLLSVLCLASCTEKLPETETTTPETTDEPHEPGLFDPLEGDPILLAEGGKTYYKLIRPQKTTDDITACYRVIANAYEEKAGSVYAGADDWYREGTDITTPCEVLLGNTNRPETRQVMEAIGFDDYAVAKVGNKIVIAAHNPRRLYEAAVYFRDHLTTIEGSGSAAKMIYTGNYHFESGKHYVFNAENKLEDYRIVYRAGRPDCLNTAVELASAFKKSFKIEVPVVADSEPAVECEIVLGAADRDIVHDHILTLGKSDYVIATSGKTVLIASPSDAFTSLAVTKFIGEQVNGTYSYTINFEADSKKINSAYSFQESSFLATGADIRIMSFNILCEKWNDRLPVEGRDYQVTACVNYFAPDVIGFQEVSDAWYASLNKLIGGTYAFTDSKTPDNKTNFSTLAYNKETLTMLDHGVILFSQGNNVQLRLVTWALFEVKATGKKFIACSTHWDLGSNPQYQQVHSDEMADIVLRLQKTYNAPVLTTGDYNTDETTTYYANFLKKSGYKDAKYTASIVNRDWKSYHNVGECPPSSNKKAIDHIFGSPEIKFAYYNLLVDQVVLDASDHCPIYADVILP